MNKQPSAKQRELTARASRLLPLRPAEMEILLILGSGPLHAYGISKEAEESGQALLGLGSLYRTLNRLRTDGLIVEDEDAAQELGPRGQARRPWRLTQLGRFTATAEAERLQRVVAAAKVRRFLTEEGD